jgi:hypothetical protein
MVVQKIIDCYHLCISFCHSRHGPLLPLLSTLQAAPMSQTITVAEGQEGGWQGGSRQKGCAVLDKIVAGSEARTSGRCVGKTTNSLATIGVPQASDEQSIWQDLIAAR